MEKTIWQTMSWWQKLKAILKAKITFTINIKI